MLALFAFCAGLDFPHRLNFFNNLKYEVVKNHDSSSNLDVATPMDNLGDALNKHLNDPGRLAALRAVALLDTPSEEAFDRLCRLAARITGVPIALVSLIDADRQFFKSCIGFPEPWSTVRQTALSHSFCQHNRTADVPLIITDARENPLFRDNLAIRDLNVIAYLGIPLVNADAYIIGSFCVIDVKPRSWTDNEVETIRDLAGSVMTEIDLRTEIALRKELQEDRDSLSALYTPLQEEKEAHYRTEEALREALLRQNEAVKMAKIGLWDWDLITHKVHYTAEWKEQIGYENHEITDDYKEWESRVHPDDLQYTLDKVQRSISEAQQDYQTEFRFRHKNGTYRWILARGSVIKDASGRSIKMMGSHIDITERKRVESDLYESEEKLRLFIDHAPAALAMFDRQMRYIAASRRWMLDYGLGDKSLIGRSHYDVIPEIPDTWKAAHQRGMEGEVVQAEEEAFMRMNSDIQWLFWEVRPWRKNDGTVGGIVIFTADRTERKLAEEDKNRLEAQLVQAQKMESVGRLAGGVAHDYNNMLSVIIGYAELGLEKLDPAEPLHGDLTEILSAANRSMNITRQLLAFARKQTIAPEVLELNETVEQTLKMLRRLIGEDIDLLWHPREGVWPVKIDPGQVDQILANLCVNARDAIVDTGRVTIETDRVTFDDDYCAAHAGFTPGEFAVLAISDNGKGIEVDDMEQIFEPFFTTKKKGMGTGLGLATVYGIVKQNSGFINVYSEPGEGTTIKVYLPRHTGKVIDDKPLDVGTVPNGRGELILVVEDETSILKLTKKILIGLGYRVLLAQSPSAALQMAEMNANQISLLITDVVMPEMNGRELSERLQMAYPQLRCLFMSGYTANVIAHRGVLKEGVHYVQKPFSKKELAIKVRAVLDHD